MLKIKINIFRNFPELVLVLHASGGFCFNAVVPLLKDIL